MLRWQDDNFNLQIVANMIEVIKNRKWTGKLFEVCLDSVVVGTEVEERKVVIIALCHEKDKNTGRIYVG